MSLLINTHLRLAVDSLRRNRGRTFLSALGIAIGVASIVLIMSLTGAIGRMISASDDKANANLILVRPSNGKLGAENLLNELTSGSQYNKSNLTLDDSAMISALSNVAAAAPIAATTAAVTVGDKAFQSVNIVATSPDLALTTPLPLKNGDFLKNDEHLLNTAVLGHSVAGRLFGSPDAVTGTFRYHDELFIVIGVLEKLDDPINYNGVDFDNAVLINTDFAKTFEASMQIQQINLRTTTTDSTHAVADDIRQKLSDRKNGDTTFLVLSGHDNFRSEGSLFSVISYMLTLVASISLIIGGVGIMNIMLVSVSERTREIGIRKAVGASSGNILLQFLFESIILSLMGGLMGFVLGYVCAFLISLFAPFAPSISWPIILTTGITSLTTGVVFGIYPAARAAGKDPIASLKEFR